MILNASARNWIVTRSDGLKSFVSELSRSQRLGPMMVSRPALPYVPTGCSVKQLVLNQALSVWKPLYRSHPATAFGRPALLPVPVYTRLGAEVGLNGAPER